MVRVLKYIQLQEIIFQKNSFRNISLLNILKNSLYLLNANKWNKLHNKIIQKSSKNLDWKILGLSMNNIDLSQKKYCSKCSKIN